jgi:hypothetical protein
MAVAYRSSASTSYATRTNTIIAAPSGLANDVFCWPQYSLASIPRHLRLPLLQVSPPWRVHRLA